MKQVYLILLLLTNAFLLSSIAFAQVSHTDLAIVYEEPYWGTSTTKLTPQEIINRFDILIYSRSKMLNLLPTYKSAGWNGETLLYLTALDRIAAPNEDYVDTEGQLLACDEVLFKPTSDNIVMDRGDFCEIQNAIVAQTCLLEYPDICPTENFFIHDENGNRYSRHSNEYFAYNPNPADENFRKYVKRRAQRELFGGIEVDYDGTTRSHPATGASSIFLDNVELSWDKFVDEGENGPKEFNTSDEYALAVGELVEYLNLNTKTSISKGSLWGNLISDPNKGNDWKQYMLTNSLDGILLEDFMLDWGRGSYSSNHNMTQLQKIDSWQQNGGKLILIGQANRYISDSEFEKQAKFTLATSLLAYSPDNILKIDNYEGDPNGNRSENYHQYYEFSEYFAKLGLPYGQKQLVSKSPLVYKRYFNCGSVTVDFTNGIGGIKTNRICLL